MAKQPSYVNFRTPVGTARFPKIDAPDTQGKYADNKFKTGLVLDDAGMKAMDATLNDAAKALWPGVSLKDIHTPKKRSKDKKSGEEVIEYMFKSKRKPNLYSAQREKLAPGSVSVQGGAKIAVGGTIKPYESKGQKGITAYLEAVQIIELPAYFDPSTFDSHDDGFTAEQAQNAQPVAEAAEGADADPMDL